MPTAYNGPPHCSTCGTPKSVCTWTEDDYGVWRTDCGNAWGFTLGGPSENDTRYCCFCGGPLKAQPYVWETDEDEECERATENGIERDIEEGTDETPS